MKKKLSIILTILLVVTLALTFSLAGCAQKAEEAAVTEEAVEEAPADEEEAEAVEEVPAEEEAVEEEVVAEETLLYAFPSTLWGINILQSAKYGAQQFDNYFGDKVTVEYAGPMDFDADAGLAALEAMIVKNPVGLLWLPLGIGEDQLLNDYHDSGGLIGLWGGAASDAYPYEILTGTSNVNFGKELANWAIDIAGEEFKLGIMTMTDLPQHIQRTQGIKEVIAEYPGIELVEPLIEQSLDQEQAVANATAFVVNNPDVDVYLGTAGFTGQALGTALKEAGYNPQDKIVITSDIDAEVAEAIKGGYVTGTLGQSFAVEIFYNLLSLHMLHENAVSLTKMDAELGIVPAPSFIETPANRIDADNVDVWMDMPMPE